MVDITFQPFGREKNNNNNNNFTVIYFLTKTTLSKIINSRNLTVYIIGTLETIRFIATSTVCRIFDPGGNPSLLSLNW